MSNQSSSLNKTLREIERFASRLQHPQSRTSLEDVLALGKLVVDRLYDGDLEAVRRRGKKAPSFRELAKRPDLKVSPVSLYRAVAIYELSTRIGPLTQWEGMGPTHFRAILGLEEKLQLELLDKAAEQGWSVRGLEAEVAKVRPNNRSGRRRIPEFVRAVRSLADARGGFDAEHVALVERDELQEIYDATVELKARLSELEQQLRPHVSVVPLSRSSDESGEFHRRTGARRIA